jgi:L-alanine-DL-glutamate epimerase-like enolase superfamily enzyme
MASAWNLPVTTHDCCGPLVNLANVHLSLAAVNALNTESVRAFYDGGWYTEVIEDRLPIRDGSATAPPRPGIGTRLRDEYRQRADVLSRTSTIGG